MTTKLTDPYLFVVLFPPLVGRHETVYADYNRALMFATGVKTGDKRRRSEALYFMGSYHIARAYEYRLNSTEVDTWRG